MASTDDLRAQREMAVRMLARLPSEEDPLKFQKFLVHAHTLAAGLPNEADVKQHRRLLRIIGDGLAWRLLGQHAVRNLSNHPGKPAAFKENDPDFQFVLEVATEFQARGFLPIICDLTNLLLVGDIIILHPAGIEIVECKNTRDPQILDRPGRLFRQRQRGEGTADYLSESVMPFSTAGVKVAQDVNFPDYSYSAVTDAAEKADLSPSGVGVTQLGPRDYVVIVKPESDLGLLDDLVPDRPAFVEPILSMHSTFLRNPSWVAPPVTAYAITADLQIRLLELDIMMLRICDLSVFNEEGPEGPPPFTVRKRGGMHFLDLGSKRPGAELSGRFIDGVAFAPVRIADTRDALVQYVKSIPSEVWEGIKISESVSHSVKGSITPTNYLIAFRGESGEILIATRWAKFPGFDEEVRP